MKRVRREEFRARLEGKMPEKQIYQIMLAYKLAKYGHAGRFRDDGTTRYFEHPKEVALILIDELGIYDHRMIVAALLHDIEEDTNILGREDNWSDIAFIFGKRVAHYVKLLTKDTAEEKYIERLRRATKKSQIIKLADRLHNARTLGTCTSEKQQRYIQETNHYFLPWAESINPYVFGELLEAIAALQKAPGE